VITARRTTTGLKTASTEKVVNGMDGPIKQVNPMLERAKSNVIIVVRWATNKANVVQIPKTGPTLVAMENRGAPMESPRTTDRRTPRANRIQINPLTLGQRSHI
jgi:hypothetical protein